MPTARLILKVSASKNAPPSRSSSDRAAPVSAKRTSPAWGAVLPTRDRTIEAPVPSPSPRPALPKSHKAPLSAALVFFDAHAASQAAQSKIEQGLLTDAKRILAPALSRQPTNLVFWQQFLIAHAQEPDCLLDLIEEMHQAAGSAKARFYNKAMSLLLNAAMPRAAEIVFETMVARDVTPDVCSFTEMIRAASSLRGHEAAKEVFEKMTHAGLVPDVFSWTALLQGYFSAEQYEPLWVLFCDMRRSAVVPNSHTLAVVLRSCAQHQSRARAQKLYAHSLSTGWSLDAPAFNAMLQCLPAERLEDGMRQVFRDMKARGVAPTQETWGTRIHRLAKEQMFASATSDLHAMRASGLKPSRVVYNGLLAGLADHGQKASAVRILDGMREEEIAPDVKTYTSMFHLAAKSSDFALAQDLFARMKVEGILLDEAALTAFSDAAYCAGAYLEGAKVLNSSWTGQTAQIHRAELLRKSGDFQTARSLCREILQGNLIKPAVRDHAWIVSLYCLLHTDLNQFDLLEKNPPFLKDSPHYERLLCARVFRNPQRKDRSLITSQLQAAARDAHLSQSRAKDIREALSLLNA